MGRYFAGSVICTVISAVTFMVAFGFGLLGSRGASLLSSATGAVAGYWLNRTWAWGRRGRADVRRELVPYWTTIIVTAIAAALVTGAVNHVVAGITDHRGVRTLFDTAAFLGTYLVSFIVKYVVFNRVFAGSAAGAPGADGPAGGEPAADDGVVIEGPAPGEPVRVDADSGEVRRS
jgi:putative flippase GtrA